MHMMQVLKGLYIPGMRTIPLQKNGCDNLCASECSVVIIVCVVMHVGTNGCVPKKRKGRELTQPYDRSPYTDRKIQKAT